MGLDQYFLKTKNYDSTEVIYFRKYHKLDSFIRERFGTIENGGLIKLDIEDLNAIIYFVIADKDNIIFEGHGELDHSEDYYRTIGILTHYMLTQKPLYYGSDW